MAKFSNVKPKNMVYHLFCGKGVVTTITLSNGKVVFFTVKFKNCEATFDVDGYLLDKNCEREEKIVTLYWNEVKLPTEEEDKKPFDLIKYLEENLIPVDFTKDVSNDYLGYDYCDEEWKRFAAIHKDILTVYFISIYDTVLETLTNEKITPKQLKEAYKELGWL